MKKISAIFVSIFSVILTVVLLGACAQKEDYTALVSEYRSDIYYAEQDGCTIWAGFSEREYPYAADGVVSDKTKIFEIRATMPDNTKTYLISFECGSKKYGGEMSFDSVRQQYIYSESISRPDEEEITFSISEENADTATTIAAKNMKIEGTLSLSSLLNKIMQSQKETIKNYFGDPFNGEINVRLISENDNCYFYVGLIDRNGRCLSFLADAASGEVLAQRES